MTTSARPHRRLTVLGHLRLHPEAPVAHPGRRLIAFLAVHGEPVTRALAAGRLWPDLPESQARANLRRALWQVPVDWITTLDGAITLDAAVDLAAARAIAIRCLHGHPPSLREIVVLSHDLLPGWEEEWVIAPQENYRILRVQALESACRTLARAGRHTLAVQAGAAAVAAEPLCESATDALIEAHLRQGNRYAAMRCFRALSLALERELGVAPDPELAARLAEHLPPKKPITRFP